MKNWLYKDAPPAVLVIRIMTGSIFLSEGIQKFLFPQELGVGRFVKIGIPAPETLAPFVGCVEILGGILLLLGLFTRVACVPLLINMSVAIYSTKLATIHEFWKLAHEARTDYCMILGLLFLCIVGPGPLSLDARLFGKKETQQE
jgi:uncharacterized membrane protein YphA (DoxX/SURF4 family)